MTRTAPWSMRGKVVLITGGAAGIGAAGAAELSRRGAQVVLVDLDASALAETARAIGGDPVTVVADVTDYHACEEAVAAAIERHAGVDIVWANAGIGVSGPVELVDPAAWARVVQVNLIGAFNTVHAALPDIIRARGHVAVTASVGSFGHGPILSAYGASKAGVEAFADSLRVEVAHQGVTVSALHPTWIDTDMVRQGEAESAAFARLRAGLRPPFSRAYPVEVIVPAIIDGFEKRQPRLFLPGFVRSAYLLRNMLNTTFGQRDALAAAPELRQLFVDQVERVGTRRASWGRRWDGSHTDVHVVTEGDPEE
ncbi:short-chain dehydrogenase/reductase [Mycolicibacterium sp.]|uniref:short-chain dehydrogenase/reductase n=1 Tax=Mycolicibacterium sp. TaxID=2320850 RepID=UPI003D145F94